MEIQQLDDHIHRPTEKYRELAEFLGGMDGLPLTQSTELVTGIKIAQRCFFTQNAVREKDERVAFALLRYMAWGKLSVITYHSRNNGLLIDFFLALPA